MQTTQLSLVAGELGSQRKQLLDLIQFEHRRLPAKVMVKEVVECWCGVLCVPFAERSTHIRSNRAQMLVILSLLVCQAVKIRVWVDVWMSWRAPPLVALYTVRPANYWERRWGVRRYRFPRLLTSDSSVAVPA